MNLAEIRTVREAVADIEQGYSLLALCLLRGILPPSDPATIPPMLPIIQHRVDTACAGSEIDSDGRCHTCGREVVR